MTLIVSYIKCAAITHTDSHTDRLSLTCEIQSWHMSIDHWQLAVHRGGGPVTASLWHSHCPQLLYCSKYLCLNGFILTHFWTPCRLSTLLITLMFRPCGPRTRRTSLTSWAERMKLANTTSTPCATPNLRSASSRSLTACRPIRSQPGTLTPLRLHSTPPASTTVSTQSEPAEEEEK